MLLANFLELTGVMTLLVTLLLSLLSFVFIIKLVKAFKKVFNLTGGFNPMKFALKRRSK